MSEVRVIDSKTGGEKGRKPEAYGLIPAEPLRATAFIYAQGFESLDPVSDYLMRIEAFRGRRAGRRALAEAAALVMEMIDGDEGPIAVPPSRAEFAYSAIPVGALEEVAKVYNFGAYGKPNPYSAWNWLKGYSWELSFSALGRHAASARAGFTHDGESGLKELAHVQFHIFTLFEFERLKLGTDDRQPLLGALPEIVIE